MNLRFLIGVLVVVLFGIGLFAYESNRNPGSRAAGAGSEAGPAAPPAAPVGQGPPELASAGRAHAGEILEVIDVRGYTYVRLQEDTGEQIWAAISKSELKTGDRVTLIESMTMREFKSPTLNRTFETLIFAALADDVPEAGQSFGELPEGHPRVPAGPLPLPPAGEDKATAPSAAPPAQGAEVENDGP